MKKLQSSKGFIYSAIFSGLFAAAFSLPPSHAQSTSLTDSETGLLQNPGWTEVKANCLQCHSSQMIIQNSGSRAVWKSRILWMQDTQGLRQFDEELEGKILTYLESNYGPKDSARRSPVPAHLMPQNPFSSVD